MSSTKNFIRKHHIIENGDMSASINSEVLDITGLDHVAIEAIWDNGLGLSGIVQIECSITGDNWIVIGTPVDVSGSGDFGFSRSTSDEPIIQFPLLRVRWDRSGGNGNLNVYLAAKES